MDLNIFGRTIMTEPWFVRKYRQHGSIKAVAREEKITYRHARGLYLQAVEEGSMDPLPVGAKPREDHINPEPKIEGRLKAITTKTYELPKKGEVKRYLFSSAQNNTRIHEPFWNNLKVLADFYDAEIHIGRISYIKSGLGARGDKALFSNYKKETLYGADTLTWEKELEPFFHDERWEVAPGLVWCGEWNRLPTVVNPLSGFDSYTGRKSGIFPHNKLAMESIASGKFEPTKFNYTTGTVTHRNYIQKGAGLKAEFHHCYGALLVEVDSEGDWFVRQINADSEGTIYDLEIRIHKEEISFGNRVEAINWGDLHSIRTDPIVRRLMDDMLKTLVPKYQLIHDLLDFRGRNHHEIKDPFKMFQRYVEGEDDVSKEVNSTFRHINMLCQSNPNTQTVVANSNHDDALTRWMKEADWKKDPVNMSFFLKCSLAQTQAIQEQNYNFHLLEHLYYELMGGLGHNLTFLQEDESFVICEDANGGIECGMHGHLGPNGSRGGFRAFAKMGRKANVGHTHSAGIHEGVYTAGTSSELDLEYNRGPSSWSHSHILTYPNGKRAIVTMWNGKWRA
jgi:hypothetical protein